MIGHHFLNPTLMLFLRHRPRDIKKVNFDFSSILLTEGSGGKWHVCSTRYSITVASMIEVEVGRHRLANNPESRVECSLPNVGYTHPCTRTSHRWDSQCGHTSSVPDIRVTAFRRQQKTLISSSTKFNSSS